MSKSLNNLFKNRRISPNGPTSPTLDTTFTDIEWPVILTMIELTFPEAKINEKAVRHSAFMADGRPVVSFFVKVGRRQSISMYYNGRIVAINVELDFLFNNDKLLVALIALYQHGKDGE